MVRIGHPVVREQHVVGVEVARRRELRVAVELDAVAQLERVAQAVGRGGPALGQAGDDVGRADLELDEPVVDRHRRRVGGRAGREELRVEALGAAFGAVDERLGGEGGAARSRRRARHRERSGAPESAKRSWRSDQRQRWESRAARGRARASEGDDRSWPRGLVERPRRKGRVGVAHRLRERRPGRHAGRRPAGRGRRERAQRSEPVGVAQRHAERRLHGVEADAADLVGDAVDRRAELPGPTSAPNRASRRRTTCGTTSGCETSLAPMARSSRLSIARSTRGPAGVVEQAGEVAVERVEPGVARRARLHRRALRSASFQIWRRRARRERARRAYRRSAAGRRWRSRAATPACRSPRRRGRDRSPRRRRRAGACWSRCGRPRRSGRRRCEMRLATSADE